MSFVISSFEHNSRRKQSNNLSLVMRKDLCCKFRQSVFFTPTLMLGPKIGHYINSLQAATVHSFIFHIHAQRRICVLFILYFFMIQLKQNKKKSFVLHLNRQWITSKGQIWIFCILRQSLLVLYARFRHYENEHDCTFQSRSEGEMEKWQTNKIGHWEIRQLHELPASLRWLEFLTKLLVCL